MTRRQLLQTCRRRMAQHVYNHPAELARIQQWLSHRPRSDRRPPHNHRA